MKKEELIKLIRNEIKWHEEDDNIRISTDSKKGFIAGLKQAILLINKAYEQ